MRTKFFTDNYRGANAFFVCDVCSQRWRRSEMYIRWDNLRVDIKCNDPRPPQMSPPDLYPEGQPFEDARPPQDNPDQLTDGSALRSVSGGMVRSVGVQPVYNNGQVSLAGALSPMPVFNSPDPASLTQKSTIALRTIRSGPVAGINGGED